jgi:hypothetical protein
MHSHSEQILADLASAYSSEQVLEILDINTEELLCILIERVEANIHKFELRPLDCNEF